jgi:hypothetical protein
MNTRSACESGGSEAFMEARRVTALTPILKAAEVAGK